MAFIYNLTDTWNDAATTWNGIKLAVSNTGSSASSNLLNLTVTGASTASFVVDKSGNLVLNGSVNKITFTAPATGATLTLADNSTFVTSGAYSSTFTFSGTTTLTFPTSGTVTALGNTTTGSGAIVLASSPTLVTPALGTPSSGVLSSCTGYAVGNLTGTGTGVLTALAVNVGSAGAFVTFNGALGTPSSGNLSNCTGYPVSGLGGLGTGVATALAVNVGSAGAFVVNGGALGTPSSGTLTNATGLPISTGVDGLGTGVATFLATPTSANLAAAVTNETGSGPLVFATSPTFTSQVTLGTASSTRGTLVLSNTSANTVTLQSSNTTAANYTLTFPAAAPVNGYYLQTDSLGVLSWAAGGGGGGGSPGGSNTQVQFNDSATFGGMPAFTYDKTTYTLGLGVASTSTGTFSLYNSASANSVSLKSGNNSAAWSLTLPTTAGTANYFLQTDGSGNTTWAAAAAGTINTGTVGQITYYSGTNTLSGTTTGTGVLTALGNNTNVAGGVLVPAAALTASALVVGGGSGTGPSTITTGTGVVTALGVNTGSAGAFVVNGGALGTPSSGNLSSCTNIPVNQATGTLPVANGGTGLTSGTSGGVLYYSATGTLASSAALTASSLVIGGGAGVAPSTTTTGTGVITAIGNAVNASGGFITYATYAPASGKTLTVSNSITLAGADSTTMTFPSTSSTVLTTGNTATITKGFTVTPYSIGTVSSGTTTPDPANGNYQYLTNGGAFTLAAPSSDCAIDLLIINGASSGAITFSGFKTPGTNVSGATYATTNSTWWVISIRRTNSISTYSINGPWT